MKVKCLTSKIHPVFIVGETYTIENNEIYGNESRDTEMPWVIGNDLKIVAEGAMASGVLASFEAVSP